MRRFKSPLNLIVLAVFLSAGAAAAPSQTGKHMDVEGLVAQLETAEQGRDAGLDQQDFSARLAEADRVMGQRLQQFPKHVPTLILAARLERFIQLAKIGATPRERLPDAHVSVRPVLAKLERAAALAPRNADIWFWKARTWGMRLPARRPGRVVYAPVDLERAIEAARKAVNLDPSDDRYRAALALLLVENRQAPAALSVMQDATDKRHPIYLLLGDFINIPVPANAVYSASHSERFALMQMVRGRYQDYPQLRVRYYLVPTAVEELERIYRDYWQGFRFILKGAPKKIEKGLIRLYAQHLSYQQGAWHPAIEESDIPKSPDSGILLSAMEMRGLPDAMREKTLADFDGVDKLGDVFSFLIVVNYRAAK